MRLNRYLATTLFTGLFLSASIFTPSAMGQEQTLQPQGAWALTKIDRSAQGGNSYCTLSRKYDNGVVLSLGRNQTEEYSLAVDFQKQTFEKGKSLKINLQPGPGQIRAYDMMPASEKAVVVRLGWDTGFFDALNKSQQMKVNIADKNYAFALPEIAKGQQDLTECMEGLQTAAKAAKGGTQVASASKDVLNADPAANKEFDAAKANNAAPAGAPKAALPQLSPKEQVAAAEQSVLKNFADNMQAQEQQAGTDEGVKRRNFGGATEEKAAKVADASKTPAPVPPSAQKELELVKRPAPLATAAVAAAPATTMAAMSPAAAFERDEAQAKALQKQIDDLKAQNQTLQTQNQTLAQKATAPSPQTQQQLASVQTDKAAIEQKLAAAEAEKAAMKEQLSAAGEIAERAQAMQKQLAELQTQNQTLQAQNQTLTQKASTVSPEVQQQLAKADADKAALKKQIEELAAHNQALQPKGMTPLPDETQALAAVKKENAALQKQLADLKMQTQTLQAQNQTLAQKAAAPVPAPVQPNMAMADAEKAELQKQIDDLKAQNMALQQVQQAKGAAPAATAEQQQALAAAQTGKAALEKQVADLTAQNMALQQKTVAGAPADQQQAFAALQAEKTALQQKVEAMQKAQASMKQTVDAAAADPRIKELEAKNAQLEDSLRQAQVRIGETAINTESKSMKRLNELESKLLAAQNDNTTLAKQLESLRLQQEDKTLTAVAGDWNLESATKRFNEAERENRRLGLQLEQERTSCNREKAEIEQMLFDPAVTDQKQLERLTALEEQLDTANAKIASMGGQPVTGIAGSQPGAAPVPAVDQLSLKQDSQASADYAALRGQNMMLRQDAEKLRAQLTDVTTNGGARVDQLASMQLQMEEMKRQTAMKDKQLATYQSQIAMRGQPSGEAFASITPAAGTVSPVESTIGKKWPVKEASVAPSGADKAGYDKNSIQSLLQKSGLTINGVSASSAGLSGADNFKWTDSNNVSGLASVKMLGSKDFDDMVAQYVTYQKGQCDGDFASIPSPSTNGAKKMALYEVACVGGKGNQSASLIFFEDQGRFIAIANQIQAADMDLAMDSRDRIAGFVKGL